MRVTRPNIHSKRANQTLIQTEMYSDARQNTFLFNMFQLAE
jgi:hypothetical protein